MGKCEKHKPLQQTASIKVRMTPVLYEWICRVSGTLNVSMSELMRRAVEEYREDYEMPF